MLPGRLPLTDLRRQRLRDDRLWSREVLRARQFGVKKLHCPCTECQGRKKLLVKNVRDHLLRHGRHPELRVWTGAGNRDSSDDDWEEEFWGPNQNRSVRVDAQVDTRGMIHNAFAVEENTVNVEDRIRQEVAQTFMVADEVHEQCNGSPLHDDANTAEVGEGEPILQDDAHSVGVGEDEPIVGAVEGEIQEDVHFDPSNMEEAIQELYSASRCTKLAATILLMNLCTVHGVSNNFVDELFTLLHGHILPERNCLPKNFHAGRSLMQKLGLSYNSIHACEKGCVLFRGEHAEAVRCPRCQSPRFKDEERRRFPVKVLRHFPIIPRLQRMFRSPNISKLMLWHSENQSNREGGDGLVRHPCDSKAWRHFHDNVDPTFANDPRNTHFALAADGVNPFKQNRSTWSTWPVLLLNYNLPPWLSTKKFFVLLALLIPGK